MLGSYAPPSDGQPYTKKFEQEESPSGMLARSGTYHVRSRVVDDDAQVYCGKCQSHCSSGQDHDNSFRFRVDVQNRKGVVTDSDMIPSLSSSESILLKKVCKT